MRKLFFPLVVSIFLLLGYQLLVSCPASAIEKTYFTEDDDYIYIGNQYLELVFKKSDGELYGIKQKSTNTEFVKEKDAWWSLYDFVYYEDNKAKYVGGWLSNSFKYSSRNISDGIALDLSWNGFAIDGTSLDMQVTVTVEVEDNSPLTYWTIGIKNNENITIESIDFPAISGFGEISIDPENDYLVYPSTSGLLFQNPLNNIIEDQGWGWEMYYPSAYSTMQFMAYYSLDPIAGLYIASYDPDGGSKFFDFSKSDTWLHMKIRHITEFVVGADYNMDYKTVVGVFSGDWYDAAQVYRTWALEQNWTSKGLLTKRADIPDWYKLAGLRQWIYTYPLCYDTNPFSIVSEIMNDTASYFNSPVITSWIGWERQGWYAKYPDVFPPKEGWNSFQKEIRDIHGSGNRVLFIPDTTSYSSLAPSWSSAEPFAVQDKLGNYPGSGDFSECGETATFYIMCPATSFWQDKLKSMLSTLSQKGGDEIQLDGFPIFGPQACNVAEHGHQNGGGTWWYKSYQQIFDEFKTAASLTNPDLILSSEGMAESYIPLLDTFWDPFTTGWSPNQASSSFKDTSKVQIIPLWHAVYHDYTLLESGITFVSNKAPAGSVGYGDYRDFYVRGFGLALVWGEMPCTWYADEKISELDEQSERDMADYLRRIVEARIGYAKQYLMYGSMLKPPTIEVPEFHINEIKSIPYTGNDYPAFDSPAVLSSAWKATSGEVGYVFTNISHDAVTFNLTIDSSEMLLLSEDSYSIIQNKNGLESTLLTDIHLPQTLTIQTEPLDIVSVFVKTGKPTSFKDLTGRWKKFKVRNKKKITEVKGKLGIKNISVENLGKFKTTYYLSDDNVFNEGDKLIKSQTIRSLLDGKSKVLQFTYSSKVSLKGKFIIAKIDSDDQILESDEDNNIIGSAQIR